MTVSLASLNLRKSARGVARPTTSGRQRIPAVGRVSVGRAAVGKAIASKAIASKAITRQASVRQAVARRVRPAPDLSTFVALTPLDLMLDKHLADGRADHEVAMPIDGTRRAAARSLLIGGLVAGTLLAVAVGGLIAVSVAVVREVANA